MSAVGKATPRSFFMSEVENSSPMENMRKTMPSCPMVRTLDSSAMRLPPSVWRLMTTPARM